MRAAILVSSLAITLFFSRFALAVETEAVHLRDGSIIQGELVEKVPGDHVTLKLATGEVRRIEWAAIQEDQPKEEPQMLAAFGGVASPQTNEQPKVSVALSSDTESYLVEVTDLGHYAGSVGSRMAYGIIENYRRVCVLPCRAELDPLAEYWVEGPHMPTTSRFRIDPRVSELRVRSGSRAMLALGATSFTLGFLATLGGGVTLLTGLLVSDTSFNIDTGKTGPNDTKGVLITTGVGLLIGAAVCIGAGIPLVALGSTKVEMPSGARIAKNVWLTPSGLSF